MGFTIGLKQMPEVPPSSDPRGSGKSLQRQASIGGLIVEVRTETQIISVTLTMSNQEAEWLKSIMQNPFCSDCGRESKNTELMRLMFFHALNGEMSVRDEEKYPEAEEKYPEAEEKYEVPSRKTRVCLCGESDPKKLVFMAKLMSGPYSCEHDLGFKKYEHFIQCATCKACGPSVYTDSTETPPELHRWGYFKDGN